MKKISIIFLVLLLMLTVGCSTNNEEKVSDEPDTSLDRLVTVPTTEAIDTTGILDKAASGVLEPMKAIIGDNLDKVYVEAEKANSAVALEAFDSDTPYALFDEGRYYVAIIENQKIITKMTTEINPYGLSTGVVRIDDFINSIGAPEKRETVAAADLYFTLDKSSDAEKISYTAGENTVEFYFVNDLLSAVVLAKNK